MNVRVLVGPGRARASYALAGLTCGCAAPARPSAPPCCEAMRDGRARGAEIAHVVSELRRAGKGATASNCAEWLAAEADAERRGPILAAARLASGGSTRSVPKRDALDAAAPTLRRDIGDPWFSGDLARKHPTHVRAKKSSKTDKSRCETHIWPTLGDKPLASITLEDCEHVVSEAPEGSQRHVAQLLGYMLTIAVYPMKLLEVSPLPPRKWLPKKRSRKALSCLFPEEEAQLLACRGVPIESRVLYGFVAREGMRASEALRMTWSDLDLDTVREGTRSRRVELDANKTDDPRNWTLDEGVAEALRRWEKLAPPKKKTDLVFGSVKNKGHLADVLRTRHIPAAGITRAKLVKGSSARQRVRFHDFRASFVTVALAVGRTEAWIAKRTGHRSSTQINAYRRDAETLHENGVTWFVNMAEAIPELAELGPVGHPNCGRPIEPEASRAPKRRKVP
ncbi:MAG: tyrosine-type recombinase/integrase, partial [Labilithrix sp.]|nr:tyrosine-type recombinase/integrase [Labilithrix sp.]